MMADLIERIERGVPPWSQALVACADPGLPLRFDDPSCKPISNLRVADCQK